MSKKNETSSGVEAKAVARHLRYSPQKGRLVADMVRGKNVDQAIAILTFSKRAAAKTTLKVLRSAMANAADNKGLSVDELYVKTIFVDGGKPMKRWLPRARGRADRIFKRTCHTTVILAERA
jgi:large subunit ribosomal protein L22